MKTISELDISILTRLARLTELSESYKQEALDKLDLSVRCVGEFLIDRESKYPKKYNKLVESLLKWRSEDIRQARPKL